MPPITGVQAGSLGSIFFIVQLLSSHKTFGPGKQGHQTNMLYVAVLSSPSPGNATLQAACPLLLPLILTGPVLGIAHRAGGVKPSLSCCCLSFVR